MAMAIAKKRYPRLTISFNFKRLFSEPKALAHAGPKEKHIPQPQRRQEFLSVRIRETHREKQGKFQGLGVWSA